MELYSTRTIKLLGKMPKWDVIWRHIERQNNPPELKELR